MGDEHERMLSLQLSRRACVQINRFLLQGRMIFFAAARDTALIQGNAGLSALSDTRIPRGINATPKTVYVDSFTISQPSRAQNIPFRRYARNA